jgi:indolepyruvate ferredoxin oxidoreductase beta subunit
LRAGALPFPRTAFEAAVRRGQVGVTSSLAAFASGFEAARSPQAARAGAGAGVLDAVQPSPQVRELCSRPDCGMKAKRALSLTAALERLIDYRDADCAGNFWRGYNHSRRSRPVMALATAVSPRWRQLALGMAYQDTIRVAEQNPPGPVRARA